jgi:pyruvate kinase
VIDWQPTEMLRRRRTKIVATLGPASSDPATVEALAAAGVDVFRLNLSHGDREAQARACAAARASSAATGSPIAVLAELSGPEIRVGSFGRGGIVLTEGEPVTLTTRDLVGTPGTIPARYPTLHEEVASEARIVLGEGRLELQVVAVEGTEIACRVLRGGALQDGMEMRLPDSDLAVPALTERGLDDLRFALELGVDYVTVAFVRRAADIEQVRAAMAEAGAEEPPRVIARIERPQALREIEGIVDAADGVLVARGDLGVELPPEAVPVVQRELVAVARAHNKPCIVATQMLESMVTQPEPTRAEVSDVSTAVFGEADAVMLSVETAGGAHPVEAVRMMDRIARRIEAHLFAQRRFRLDGAESTVGSSALAVAVARATAQLSRDLHCRAIVVVAPERGSDATVRIMSAARPGSPVVAAMASARATLQTSVLWGVIPARMDAADLADPAHAARRLARRLGLAEFGEHVLVVEGFHEDSEEDAPRIAVIRV